jgi:hypothetical protein
VRRFLWLVCLLVVGVACKRGTTVAEVTKPRGDVKRDTASTMTKWEAAPEGAKLALGDGVKTGPSAETVVRLTSGGTIAVSSNTTIRLLASKPGAANPKVGVEAGEASIEAESGALDLETSIGSAHIEAGGKLRVTAGDSGTRVEVTVGAARIDTEGGGVDLTPGKSFDVSVGGAIVEADPDAKDAGADETKAAVAEPEAAADDGKVVLQVHGSGVRVQAKGASAWTPIKDGAASAAVGDTLDVPNGASVDAQRGRIRGRVVGQGKFVLGEGGALARATSGRVELEATSDDVVVDVPGGTIVAKGGAEGGKSRVAAEVRANDTKVTVRQGQGEIRGKNTETVRAGESATLDKKGVAVVAARGLDRSDLAIRAGESIIIRDPKGVTAVGFDFSSVCPGAAVVARGAENTGAVRGDRRVNMAVPGGHHEYTVRCIGADGVEDKPAATGAVTVVADSARALLPKVPPATLVDMDGRRYTVLYQNQLPSVIARWADAPPGKSYVLRLDKDRIKSDTAKKELKTGTVSEGTHTLSFETEDGSKKSAETVLVIKFDNAAPAASVREPADGSFSPGDSVKVAGVVVEGWTVQVNGQPVPLDEQKRFSTTTVVPANETAIVLKLSHPKRGTVHYVRHAAPAR